MRRDRATSLGILERLSVEATNAPTLRGGPFPRSGSAATAATPRTIREERQLCKVCGPVQDEVGRPSSRPIGAGEASLYRCVAKCPFARPYRGRVLRDLPVPDGTQYVVQVVVGLGSGIVGAVAGSWGQRRSDDRRDDRACKAALWQLNRALRHEGLSLHARSERAAAT